ncbi:MAG: DUF4214 domain-containing protein [Acidimicrobiales bacterium]|nr:DUF4214 domain-containing protein [Acidimicrobiales bacterium]
MVRVRRVVRRSLTIAVLATLLVTVFANPEAPALAGEKRPGTEILDPGSRTSAGGSSSTAVVSASLRDLDELGASLSVGHGDVLRLYWAFFERDPDLSGARYWIDVFNDGASIDAIAFAFSSSAEFRQTYGATSDRDFVRIVYANVLGRQPDSSGFAYWTGLLRETPATRVDVVRWISGSTEFIAAHPFRSETVRRAVDADSDVAAAVDVVESLALGRSTGYLPQNRSDGLSAAIENVRKRFGAFSTVVPAGACTVSGQVRSCPIAISEVGVTATLIVQVVQGQVVGIDGAVEANPDAWALDLIHAAVAGRDIADGRGLSPEAAAIVRANVARIAPTIGATGTAVLAPLGDCSDSVVSTPTGGSAIERRACSFDVTGPVMTISVEAVTHNGVFAGVNIIVPRHYAEQNYTPYATIGDVILHHPADRVERIGFHESGHDGSQAQIPVKSDTKIMTMRSRNRGNDSHSAADIVVHPEAQIRAPVTGTVLRAGTYTLYCKYSDHYLVIEPDTRPGFEVKVLHFEGLAVAKGDRVVAGQTVVGSNARKLPFNSQVDDFTADPSSGHIHIEVVDPSIPDRPSGGGC